MNASTFWLKARGEGVKHAFILAILAIELFPLYMTLQVSVKSNADFMSNPWWPLPPGEWKLENWQAAARLLLPSAANSLFVATLTTIAQITVSFLGAYFFARKKVAGAAVLWPVFMVLMMLPTVVNIVPLFSLLQGLRLLDTLWALIFVGIAAGQAFNLFILRNFMEDIPRDLFDAADVDGGSHFDQIRHVALPMSMPIVGTLAILTFLGSWNDFLLPLVVLRDPELFTVGVRLIYLDGEYVRRWGQLMAAFVMAATPLFLLFLFTMRWFVKGLSAGAVKG